MGMGGGRDNFGPAEQTIDSKEHSKHVGDGGRVMPRRATIIMIHDRG